MPFCDRFYVLSNGAGASTLPSYMVFSAPALSSIFKTPDGALDSL